MKANSTFHSSGTASGNVEAMNRWKNTMNSAASRATVVLVANSSTSGTRISTVVPPTCAMNQAKLDGFRSPPSTSR